MNDDLRDLAHDIRRVSDWIFIAGLLWLAGFGLLIASVVFRWHF